MSEENVSSESRVIDLIKSVSSGKSPILYKVEDGSEIVIMTPKMLDKLIMLAGM